MTITVLKPMALATIARPMPVLPAVPSTMVPPGRSVPLRIASPMMKRAARSFTDWPGFMNSALPRMVQPVASEARRSLISGVLPMAARTSSLICMSSLVRSDQAVGPGLRAADGRIENLGLIGAWNVARGQMRHNAHAERKIARIRHVEPAQELAGGQAAGKIEVQHLGTERVQPPLDAGDCFPHSHKWSPGLWIQVWGGSLAERRPLEKRKFYRPRCRHSGDFRARSRWCRIAG